MHGGDIYTFEKETGKIPLDFSENTNPYLLPEGVKKAIIASVDSYHAYPDLNCRNLSKAVANYYGVLERNLLFGNGAADIIYRIGYGLKPSNVLVLAPTFSEYEESLKSLGTKINYYKLREDENFIISKDVLKFIKGNDIVYICNPNNPTGKVCSKEMMLGIARKCKEVGAYLVVDECFMDFAERAKDYSLMGEISEFPTLIILKAFTKIYAMAGLRLGFCISSNLGLLNKIRDAGQPWSVSTVAQVAGVACCEEKQYLKESLGMIAVERAYLLKELKRLKLQIYESDVNYLLFKCKRELIKPLSEAGIMIRSCENYKNLNHDYYRIAVKRHFENEQLVRALESILETDKCD